MRRPSDPENVKRIKLLQDLDSDDPDIRYQAVLEVRTLEAGEVAELVALTDRTRKHVLHVQQAFIGVGTVCLSLWLLSRHLIHPIAVVTSSALFFLWQLWIVWIMGQGNARPGRLLTVVENVQDARNVASVLHLMGQSTEASERERLHSVLLSMLPKLQPEDAREWKAEHISVLKTILRSWTQHETLTLVLLQAMPQIGGKWALEDVERLAEFERYETQRLSDIYTKHWQIWHGYREPSAGQVAETVESFRRIGRAATECLPGLRERIREAEASASLLRPSYAVSRGEELLRPAGDRCTVPETTNLLRAASPPEEQTQRQ